MQEGGHSPVTHEFLIGPSRACPMTTIGNPDRHATISEFGFPLLWLAAINTQGGPSFAVLEEECWQVILYRKLTITECLQMVMDATAGFSFYIAQNFRSKREKTKGHEGITDWEGVARWMEVAVIDDAGYR